MPPNKYLTIVYNTLNIYVMKTCILKWGLFLAIALFYHYQQDDPRVENITHPYQRPQPSSRTLSLKELPKVTDTDFVSRQISSSPLRIVNKSYAMTPFGHIDLDAITGVIDIYRNAN